MEFGKLKNFMDDMAKERTPSNAVSIYKDGKEVFRYASGFADVEKGKALQGTEHFMIYSCSKIATVTAGLQLLERGKFLLSDPLYEYIPEFREMYVKNENGEVSRAKNMITIGDLFSMTAGFTYDIKSAGFRQAEKITNGKYDTVETIKCVAKDPLAYEPGTSWGYSIGHDVLGAVISVISGQKFRDYMKDNVFLPLGMTKTEYHPTKEILDNMAVQYRFVSKDEPELDIVEAQKYGNGKEGYFEKVGFGNHHVLGTEYDSGGAGIVTTMDDYMKLLCALADYGTGRNGEKILSSHTIELMRTNRLNTEQLKKFNWKQLAGYGYGLGVRTHMDKSVSGVNCSLGEFGWGGAAGATAIIDPKENLAVFYVQHTLNPREEYYQPRLKNVVYACLD